jgi:DNA-directed RNA polymerase subunit RPC12/RpoP
LGQRLALNSICEHGKMKKVTGVNYIKHKQKISNPRQDKSQNLIIKLPSDLFFFSFWLVCECYAFPISLMEGGFFLSLSPKYLSFFGSETFIFWHRISPQTFSLLCSITSTCSTTFKANTLSLEKSSTIHCLHCVFRILYIYID